MQTPSIQTSSPVSSASSASLADLCWRETPGNRAVRLSLLILAGIGIMAVSAQITVPFYPVPMTLQTLALLVIGMGYGGWSGVATIAGYLALGAAGAPIFSNGGGSFAHFFGPTGGYLVGFLVAAVFMAWAVKRGADNRVWTLFAALFIASVIFFLLGITQLAVFLDDWSKALAGGLYPFVIGAFCKIAIAAAVIYGGKKYLHRGQEGRQA